MPRFQTEAIEAIIKPTRSVEPNIINKSPATYNNTHSYSLQSNMPSWMIKPSSNPISTVDLLTDFTPSLYTPTRQYSHSRSKSVPYATNTIISPDSPADNTNSPISPGLFQFDTIGASRAKQQRQRVNHSGHSSLNSDSLQKIMDSGKSLLLTQGFKPKFDEEEEEKVDTRSSNNSSPVNGKSFNTNNPYLASSNPFESDNSLVSTPRQESPLELSYSPPYTKSTLSQQITLNTSLNSKYIPPPPVPPQSTKPTYLKYSRRQSHIIA